MKKANLSKTVRRRGPHKKNSISNVRVFYHVMGECQIIQASWSLLPQDFDFRTRSSIL